MTIEPLQHDAPFWHETFAHGGNGGWGVVVFVCAVALLWIALRSLDGR